MIGSMQMDSLMMNYTRYTEQKADNTRKADSSNRFQNEMEVAREEQKNIIVNDTAWAGDMVVPQPPTYNGFTYDSSISTKSKEEMTMDEYKQWFMNEMSKMPVSAWYSSTCVGGALTITEECFERMKNDPKWENTVLGMVRNMYSSSGIMGSKMIGYQVIGASPEQCYGEGIPVNNSNFSLSASDEKSWWQERHDEFEELLEAQAKAAQKKAQENRALAQEEYLNNQFQNAQRLRAFLESRMQGAMDMSSAFGNAGVVAAAAYEQSISSASSIAGISRL